MVWHRSGHTTKVGRTVDETFIWWPGQWWTLDCIFSLLETTHLKLVEPEELVKHVKPEEDINDIHKHCWLQRMATFHGRARLACDKMMTFLHFHWLFLIFCGVFLVCFFLIVTFTLHLNVKHLQSPGNLNWYIT